MGKIFTFREITEKEELEACFRFRYEIYSLCAMKDFLYENSNRIDIDCFDVHSRHFALKCGGINVGYFRVVLPKDELTNNNVLEIGKRYQLLDESEYFQKIDQAEFPFLSYEDIPEKYLIYYLDLLNRNEKLAEASRLILHPQFRSIITGKFLIECAMALFVNICVGQKHAVVFCSGKHDRFYEPYGFIPIAGREDCVFNHSNLGQALTIPLSKDISDSTVPKQLHGKLQEMAQEFLTTSKMEREI